VPGHGAVATVGGRRLAVGNPRLMAREGVPLGALEARRGELAAEGKTVVCVAVDGRAVGLLAIADAPRSTSRQAVAALRQAGIEAEAAGWPWSATA
jgi:Cu2+-exporting ATPase